MALNCSICIHPQHSQIDAELTLDVPKRTIAQTYQVSYDALVRHKKNHLGKVIIDAIARNNATVAQQRLTISDVMDVPKTLRNYNAILDRLLKMEVAPAFPSQRDVAAGMKATNKGVRMPVVLSLIAQGRKLAELLLRATGEIEPEQGGNTINILMNPQFVEVQLLVLDLVDYVESRVPEARVMATERLAKIEQMSLLEQGEGD